MGQRVNVTLPVPRSLPLAGALAWAAREFERFRAQGWDIEGEWVLDMGTDGWRGQQGQLQFRAAYGKQGGARVSEGAGLQGRERGAQGDGAGQGSGPAVVAGVQVWADGGVRWSGALTEGQRHACLTALGVAELVARAEKEGSEQSRSV